jgi:hypothetical protein
MNGPKIKKGPTEENNHLTSGEERDLKDRLDSLSRQNRNIKFFLSVTTIIFAAAISVMAWIISSIINETRDRNNLVNAEIAALNKRLFLFVEKIKAGESVGGEKFPEDAAHDWDPYMLAFEQGGRSIWEAPEVFPEHPLPEPRENPYSPERKKEGFDKRIIETSPLHFVISKSAVDESLKNLDSVVTQARVIPNFTGRGEERYVDGFRIYRIQPGSIFQVLGLRNGDIIKTTNDKKMNSVEQGILLLQALRHEQSFHVVIEREGNLFDLHYTVE